jgi:hypothetical protein
MAKVFYVVENAPDYSQVNFFKTEKEALEYGISQLPQFDMYGDPMNDEEADGEEWYTGDSLTFKKGILYTVEDGDVEVRAMDEDDAREYVTGLDDESYVAMFFDGFTKGMYGYQGTAADGKGYKWDWDGYDINESTSTGRLKHVKLFEQFTKTLNEGMSSSDKNKLKEFAAQVSDEIIDANDGNKGFDEDEYSEDEMYSYFIDMVDDYDSVDDFINEYDWRGFTMELGL